MIPAWKPTAKVTVETTADAETTAAKRRALRSMRRAGS